SDSRFPRHSALHCYRRIKANKLVATIKCHWKPAGWEASFSERSLGKSMPCCSEKLCFFDDILRGKFCKLLNGSSMRGQEFRDHTTSFNPWSSTLSSLSSFAAPPPLDAAPSSSGCGSAALSVLQAIPPRAPCPWRWPAVFPSLLCDLRCLFNSFGLANLRREH